MTELKLPKLNVNEDAATVVAWMLPDGAHVSPGDAVCTVETNKAAVDLEADASGYLRHRASPGQECATQEVLGFITESPDDPLPALEWLPLPDTADAPGPDEPAGRATLKARSLAAELDVDLSLIESDDVIRESDVRAFAQSPHPVPAPCPTGRTFAADIVGTGSYIPKRVLTNADVIAIEGIQSSDEWIQTKVGVVTRHYAADDEATSDLAVKAAERAMASAGVSAGQIGLIVLATTAPDRIFPATACIVQGKLGATNAAAFDASVMCTGSVFALDIARRYIEDGSVDYALVIGSEVYSRILDFSDRNTCIYFGDGAGAMVIGRADADEPGIITSYVQTDGSRYETITALAGGTRMPATHETVDKKLHSFRMDPKGVWEFATKAFPRAVRTVLDRAGLRVEDVDLIIPHQANINIIKAGMDSLGLPMSKVHTTLEKYGNTSAASVAVTLDEAARSGRIATGDLVVLVGFGGGLAWGAAAVRWANPISGRL